MTLKIEVKEPTEHPDVTALKRKVAEAAKEHSKRNHCGEYKSWLHGLGIEEEFTEKIAVEITFTVSGSAPQKAKKRFAVTDLAGKTEQEQNAWVAEQIAPKVDVAGTKVTLPVEVTDLSEVAGPVAGANRGTTEATLEIPEGYAHMFTSGDGRVAHLYRLTPRDRETLESATSPEGEERALRQIVNREGGYLGVTSVCGVSNNYQHWVRTSPRSEHRVCADCTRSANRS